MPLEAPVTSTVRSRKVVPVRAVAMRSTSGKQQHVP
jgi:hypothetical protein